MGNEMSCCSAPDGPTKKGKRTAYIIDKSKMLLFEGKIKTDPFVLKDEDKITENPYEIKEVPDAIKKLDNEWIEMQRVLRNI
jgi:hypothetical protein